MTSSSIRARVLRLEAKRPGLRPGLERCTDDELLGLIEIVNAAAAGEAIAHERRQWAIAVLCRENEWREGLL